MEEIQKDYQPRWQPQHVYIGCIRNRAQQPRGVGMGDAVDIVVSIIEAKAELASQAKVDRVQLKWLMDPL